MTGNFRKSLLLALLPALLPGAAAAWECPAKTGKHAAKVCQCLEARLPETPASGGPASIEEFNCPQGVMGDYDVAYRVILDLEFREIDKQAEAKLREVQGRGGKNFAETDKDVSNWFDETSADREFYKKYSGICSDLSNPDSVLGQAVAAFGSVPADGGTASFAGNKRSCDALTSRKLRGFSDSAKLLGYNNIKDSNVSDKKDFVDKLKDFYKKFIWKWTIYIGELGRIKDKWNEKTPTVN